MFFFFNHTPPTEIYTLSLHDALPIYLRSVGYDVVVAGDGEEALQRAEERKPDLVLLDVMMPRIDGFEVAQRLDRKSTRLNSSHPSISYAVFCLKKKK